jgi:hypothetical protein
MNNTSEKRADIEAPRPQWRDEYLRDLPALERYSEEMRVWQRQSDNSFERADAELWSGVTAPEGCLAFNLTLEFLDLMDASGDLERGRAAGNEARSRVGEPPLSEHDYRVRIGREYAQRVILNLISAQEA